ncbi:uncharacterized protein LOC144547432 [Carex rostrata]
MAQARRLHELLKEPQDPFYVDGYLIERGYSTKLLETQETLSFCWPRNVHKSRLGIRTDDYTGKRGGFSRGFLSKLLYWKFVKRTIKCEKKALKDAITSQNHERILNSRCFVEESGSETKKHSPVSVFEMHSCMVSPVDSNDKEEKPHKFLSLIDSPKKAFTILEELLKLAYDPSTNYISESTRNDLKEQTEIGFEDWNLNSDESTTDEERPSFSLEREHLEAIREMVISELAESMTNSGNFKFDMKKEIGTEIENAIFEEMKEELILNLLKPNCRNERC